MILSLSIYFITLILVMIIYIIIIIVSNQQKNNHYEFSTSFECGFDSISSARIPFSLRFFLLAILFVVFDIEITIILPLPIIITYSNLNSFFLSLIMFLIIILLGTLHEWNEGSLNWNPYDN